MRVHGYVKRTFLAKAALASFLLFLIASKAFAATGLEWLATQTNADGSYAGVQDITPSFQATVETLRTFHALGVSDQQPGVAAALQFIGAQTYHNAENLSRKIIAFHNAGQDVTALVNELLTLQNADGGFGELAGYDSTVLDTAYALQALKSAGVTDADVIGGSIAYLLAEQDASGGFALGEQNESSIYVTAQASLALQAYLFTYSVGTGINAASEYLFSQQLPGGGWRTTWETAYALLAVIPVTTDSGRYAQSAELLQTAQMADGSWESDVYVTALAERAVYLLANIQLPVNPSNGVFTGRVVNNATSVPLAGVTITIDQLPTVQSQSAADGGFILNDIPPGQYTVRYQLGGYFEVTQAAGVQAAQLISLGTVQLTPLPDVGVVAGIITDSQTGAPLAGVQVQVVGVSTVSAVSDATGSYSVAIAPGAVMVTALLSGYDLVSGTGTVVAGSTLQFSPSLNPTGTTPTDPTVTVKGQVVDAESAQSLAGAVVEIVNTAISVNSDASGNFTATGITAGELTIDISLAGYQTLRYTAVAPASSTVDLGTVRLPKTTAATTSTVTGIVTDQATGAPVAGANITVDGSGNGAVSGVDGSYRIEGIATTQFSVTASAVGYLNSSGNVQLPQAGVVTANFQLQAAGASDFSITQVSAPLPDYPALSSVPLTATLSNSGTADRNVQLFVKAVNADNEIVDQYPVVRVPLGGSAQDAWVAVAAGSQVDSVANWNTSRHPAGNYQVIVQAFDGSSGQLLAERGIELTVDLTNQIGGHAQFDPPIAQLAAKKPVAITANISNRGNVPIDSTTVTARVTLKNAGYQKRTDLVEVETLVQNQGLNQPQGMDTDAAGNIYVANYQANTLSRITPDGTITEYAAGLNRPVDVDIDQLGNIYVLNASGSFVRFSASGVRTEIPTGLTSQRGIEALPDGRVLIVRLNSLYEVAAGGTVTELISGGLAQPRGMTIDSLGNIYIASRNENSITKFANGRLSTYVTGINQPYGITVDSQDNLYVTSYGDNSLVKIAPDGAVTTVATGLAGPFDVKIAPNGDFVVSNSNSNEIVSITPDGTVSTLVSSTIYRPNAFAYDSAGGLYVGNLGWSNITKLAQDGTVEVVASGIAPRDMVVNADGTLEVLDTSGRLRHVALDGALTQVVTGLSGAYALLNDAGGNGYLVTETGQHRISHIDPAGVVSTYADQQYRLPRAMRRAANGDMYITSGNGYISRIDTAQTVSRVASGFNNPYGMAQDGTGNLYVAEYSNRRIMKIDPQGNVSVFANTSFYPGAVAVTPQGQVYAVAWGGTVVYSIDTAGVATAFATLNYGVYYDLFIDETGNIWAAHSGYRTVSKVAPDGTVTAFTLSDYYPRSLASDGQGGVYVGCRGRVEHIDSSGAVSSTITDPVLSGKYLYGVAVDATGRFHVMDSNGVLYLFNADASLQNRFTSLVSPRGMTYLDDGSLLVVNGNTTIIKVTSPTGLHEVVALGTYEHVSKETGNSVLLSTGGNIQRLDIASRAISSVASGYSNIEALKPSPGGGFVVGDYNRNEMAFYDATGARTDFFVGLVQPRGLIFNSAGELLVANNYPNSLGRVRSDGRIVLFTNTSAIQYMTLGADGLVSASRGSQVVQINAQGGLVRSISASDAYGLVHNANGELLFVSSSQGAVYQYASDWSYNKIAGGLSNAQDVELDTQGRINIADANQGTISVFNPLDKSLLQTASQFPGISKLIYDTTGQMIAVYNNNRVAMVDGGANRSELPLAGVITSTIGGIAMTQAGDLYASISLNHSIVRLLSGASTPDVQPGDVVYTNTVTLPALGLDGSAVAVDFGNWTPADSGDYAVEVTVDNGQSGGQLNNILHVGPNAEGSINLAQTRVFPGDRNVVGYLGVVGADSTSVTRIDASGTTLAAESRTYGRAVAADSQGNIYSADTNRIVKITPDGVVSDFVTGISVGNGMAVDSADNIYAVSGRNVIKIDRLAQVSTLATLGGTVAAVATDYSDRIYAVDSSNTLSRIDSDGTIHVVTKTGIDRPAGLTIDAYGNFYVLNQGNRIVRISPDGGTVALYFDQASFEYEGVNVTADCSNNLLFAPTRLLPFKTGGEENIVVQLVGDTGEVRQVLYGPDIDNAMSDMDVLFYDRLGKRLLIWTDLGNGKIFSFPVVCGGIDVEAHIITRGDVDLSSADPAPTSVADLADGTKEYTWVLSEVDNRGSQIQLNMLFKGLTEGETRPALSNAYLQFTNSFAPNESIQVPIGIPSLQANSAVTIQPALDVTQYGPDTVANISVNVGNESDQLFNGALALSIEDIAGNPVADLPPVAVTDLAGLSAAVYNSSWDTGDTLTGDYKLVARLINAAGTEVAMGEVPFQIVSSDQPGAVISTSVFTDKPVYDAWDQVRLDGRVRNITSNAIQLPTIAELTIRKSSGTVVFSTNVPVTEIYPNSYKNLIEQFDLIDAEAGQYVVTLSAKDAATSIVLSLSQATFQVERVASQSLLGQVTVAHKQVEAGTANVCTENVNNRSITAATGVTISHVLISMDTSQVISEAARVVDIAGNGQDNNTVNIFTQTLAPGAYACLLRITIAGVTTDLASAGFDVVVPPVKLEAGMTLGDRGRLLVWLSDTENQYEHDYEWDDDEHDHDYHDSSSSTVPTLAEQQAYLEARLQEAGWQQYTIVTNRSDFITELHRGGYSLYALLGGYIRLNEELEHELTEAVNRGEGLLIAADVYEEEPEDVLGIDDEEHRYATGLVLTNSPLHPGGQLNFSETIRVLAARARGAEVAGNFQLQQHRDSDDDHEQHSGHEYDEDDDDDDDHHGDVAVSRYVYGAGRTVFIGFNLLTQAMATANTVNDFTMLLSNALNDVHPASLILSEGLAVPVTLNLTNLGVATPGRAIVKLPAGSRLIDPGTAQQLDDTTLEWPFDLPEQGAAALNLWLQLPHDQTPVVINASVQSGVAPDLIDQTSVALSLDILLSAGLDEIISQLVPLAGREQHLAEALYELKKARFALDNNYLRWAHLFLLEAAEELAEAQLPEAAAIRTQLDWFIRDMAFGL